MDAMQMVFSVDGSVLQVPVIFADMAICFTQEQPMDLEEQQKELYKDMMENYQTLISLGTGSVTVAPDIISHTEQREEQYIRDELGSEERDTEESGCSETDVPKNENPAAHHWELSESPESKEMVSEKHVSCSYWEQNCRNQYISEKEQSDLTEDSAEITEQSSLCDVCGIFLSDPATLQSHQGSHTEERPSVGTEYVKIFIQTGELQQQEKTHRAAMSFTCSECGDEFTRQEALLQHQKVHSRDRLFSVIDSDRSLQMHHKISPGKKRPFSCFECDKRFWHEKDLVTHYINHTDKKLFSCSDCRKSFSWKIHLTEHQKVHTVNLRD
ncbi:zinc finger protein 184 [Microcaecilia unicolor]|uniref:Zinc finger protein 184-like n=1 Tax=Microcaecilia unicolor TaxID=1415580 RepID=A0A6P7XDL3_9AMPH|nr:zinc finger protein 184-like [Microcaecilia unicolor]